MAQANQRKVYIGNLPMACTAQRLQTFLRPALQGTKPAIQLFPGKRRRGKAHALVSVPENCVDGLLDLDGKVLDDSKVTVKMDSKPGKQSKWESEKAGVFVSKPHHATVGKQVPFCYDLIDCGVKLNTNKDKFASTITTAVRCGVRKLVVLGSDVTTSMDAQESCSQFSNILYCTAGFHACHAKEWTADTAELLREVAVLPHCVAMGPCGFDLSDEEGLATVEEQLLAFQAQIVSAAELGKPLVVHQMAAHVETLGQISTHRDTLGRVAVKCDPLCAVSDLDDYVAADCHIFLYGFPLPTSMELWLKHASADAEKKAAVLPRLLLSSNMQSRHGSESTPFQLNTMSKKASTLFKLSETVQNKPTSLPAVVEAAALFLKMNPEALAAQLKQNAETFFDLHVSEKGEEIAQEDDTDEQEEPNHGNDVAEELPKGSNFWVVVVVVAAALLILAHVCVLLLPGGFSS